MSVASVHFVAEIDEFLIIDFPVGAGRKKRCGVIAGHAVVAVSLGKERFGV